MSNRHPEVAGVLADHSGRVRLVDRLLQLLGFAVKFASDVDVGRVRADADARQQTALDQLLRLVAQDLPVLAGSGFTLVGIDHEIMRSIAAPPSA